MNVDNVCIQFNRYFIQIPVTLIPLFDLRNDHVGDLFLWKGMSILCISICVLLNVFSREMPKEIYILKHENGKVKALG
jgi:hypothetical protein